MLITRITGDQIRAGRSLAGLSQEALAARSGVWRQTIRTYELSSAAYEIRLPGDRKIEKIAKIDDGLLSGRRLVASDPLARERRPVTSSDPFRDAERAK
jgi:transcriptional regulator with XRE-family HTH domain